MFWTRLVEAFFLPPMGFGWLLVLGGLRLRTGRRRSGRFLLVLGALLLVLDSLPLVVEWGYSTLDRYPPLSVDDAQLPPADAVVVLDSGSYFSREQGGEVPSGLCLERMAYTAWLHRRTGKPLLLTGTTAEPMQTALERSFGLSARWVEGESRNTQENAAFTARILRDEGIRRVYLVTHFFHLPRAVAAFEAAGLEPVPAPVGLPETDPDAGWWSGLLPDADAFAAGENLWHEWIGRVWYRVRYGY